MPPTFPFAGLAFTFFSALCMQACVAGPSGYRGTPFDDAAYRQEQDAWLKRAKPLPSDFRQARILWDGKTAAAGSGWIGKTGDAFSIALSDPDSEGRRYIRYRSKGAKYEALGWKWPNPGEAAVDLTKFDAVSLMIRVNGAKPPAEMFLTIDEHDPRPISIREYEPKFNDGSWHTVTIPVADFKWTLAGKSTDRTEVHGFTFVNYNWEGADYELNLDHFATCVRPQPGLPVSPTPQPIAHAPTGQSIPGRLQCAFYDEGGEGIAYHDTDPINALSGVLNQEKNHQLPAANPYYWNFRKDEGVDISYTKSFADLNHPNLFEPPVNQLYIGAAEDGEWVNYTVNVKDPGTYKIISLYGNLANTTRFSIDKVPACVCKLPISTGGFHKWNRAEVGTIDFKKAGTHVLTLYVSKNNYAYFDFVKVEEAVKP